MGGCCALSFLERQVNDSPASFGRLTIGTSTLRSERKTCLFCPNGKCRRRNPKDSGNFNGLSLRIAVQLQSLTANRRWNNKRFAKAELH